MVEYAISNNKGEVMSLRISQALQTELAKHFQPEVCLIVNRLVEEIYANSDARAQVIFEEKQDYLVAIIIQKMYEIFATKEDLKNAMNALRQEMLAEFAKIRQEMAEMKQELKQEIAEVRTETTELKYQFRGLQKEVRYIGIGLAILMVILQPAVFDFIQSIFHRQ